MIPLILGYDANFGRRIIQNSDLDDQIVQASTLEEVKASRVRKRTFSASVISERTIQLKDEDDTNSVRNRGPEKASETTTKKTTKGKQIQCTPDLVTHLVCQKTVTKSRGVTK